MSVAWVFKWMYQPLGAALFSLLAFFVTTAIFRSLRVRNAEAMVMLVVAFIVVIGQAPFSTAAPMDVVDTPEQARQLVGNCKYPPMGHRSLGGPMAQLGFRPHPRAESTALVNTATDSSASWRSIRAL